MKARLKKGKVISGRLAKTFANLGLAVKITDEDTKIDNPEVKAEKLDDTKEQEAQKPKRKRRTKAQIEADNKK